MVDTFRIVCEISGLPPAVLALNAHVYSNLCSVYIPVHTHTTYCVYSTDSSLSFGAGNGLVIGVPIPTHDDVLGEKIETAIQDALVEAK